MITDGMSFSEIEKEIKSDLPAIRTKLSHNLDRSIQKHYIRNRKKLDSSFVYPKFTTFISTRKNKYLCYYHLHQDTRDLSVRIFCEYNYRGKKAYAFISKDNSLSLISRHFISRIKERIGSSDFINIVRELTGVNWSVIDKENVNGYVASLTGVIPFKIVDGVMVFLTYMNDLSEYKKAIHHIVNHIQEYDI